MARPVRVEGAGPLFNLIVLGFGLALFWFAMQVSVAGIARGHNPSLAVRFGGQDPRAVGVVAQRLATGSTEARLLDSAEELATAAIRRDPTAIDAFGALGLAASARGDDARAAGIFNHAESLSRRHLVTEMWLGSHDAGRGDMVGALRHYSWALATQPRSWPVLLSALANGIGNPEFDRELMKMLRTRPRWEDRLVAVASKSAPPEKAARLLIMLDQEGLAVDPRYRAIVRKRVSWMGRVDLEAKLDK